MKIPLANGRHFPLLSPEVDDIDLACFAEGLGKTPCFNGMTPGIFYSLAQHATIVERLLPDTPAGLSALGLFEAVPLFIDQAQLPMTQRRIIECTQAACGLPESTPIMHEAVRYALNRAHATAARDLMPEGAMAGEDLPEPAPFRITPLAWDNAAALWLDRIRTLALQHEWRGPAIERLFAHDGAHLP